MSKTNKLCCYGVGIFSELIVKAMPRPSGHVRRCLFGRPNPGDVDRFLRQAEEIHDREMDEASIRWGFDFRAGRPLASSDRYEWTLVCGRDSPPSVDSKPGQAIDSSVSEELAPDASDSAAVSDESSTSGATVQGSSKANAVDDGSSASADLERVLRNDAR